MSMSCAVEQGKLTPQTHQTGVMGRRSIPVSCLGLGWSHDVQNWSLMVSKGK